MGDNMRALKFITIAMGVLIVVGTLGLLIALARRGTVPPAPQMAGGRVPSQPFSAVLQEPEGSRITSVTQTGDRLAVALHGGGTDRIVLVDPHTGMVSGRISLAH